MALGRGREALDIESSGILGRMAGRFREMKLCKSCVVNQIIQQSLVRFADWRQRDLAIRKFEIGGKETAAIESLLPIFVSAMRPDPEGAVADPGGSLQIRL